MKEARVMHIRRHILPVDTSIAVSMVVHWMPLIMEGVLWPTEKCEEIWRRGLPRSAAVDTDAAAVVQR